MASSILNKAVPKCLVAPSKIARSLDWRKQSGYILSMHVGKTTIDLAATCHPELEGNPIQPLPSIPIQVETKGNQKVLKPEVVKELATIVREFKTLGLVVSWPVQKEGWCGASCGKVLHMLDQILQDGTGMGKQPICLWNGNHWTTAEDEWGRTPIYSMPTSKTVHSASQEQYGEEGLVATAIARDFLEFHWPAKLLNSSATAPRMESPTTPKREESQMRHLYARSNNNNTSTPRKLAVKSLICDRF
ncbi:hypothetical protein ACA910_012399 [Epithemia clementina (nom. ined.)]